MKKSPSAKKVTALCSACGRSWRVDENFFGTRCTCGTDQAPKFWGQKYSIRRRYRKGGAQIVEVVFAAKTANKVIARHKFKI